MIEEEFPDEGRPSTDREFIEAAVKVDPREMPLVVANAVLAGERLLAANNVLGLVVHSLLWSHIAPGVVKGAKEEDVLDAVIDGTIDAAAEDATPETVVAMVDVLRRSFMEPIHD